MDFSRYLFKTNNRCERYLTITTVILVIVLDRNAEGAIISPVRCKWAPAN